MQDTSDKRQLPEKAEEVAKPDEAVLLLADREIAELAVGFAVPFLRRQKIGDGLIRQEDKKRDPDRKQEGDKAKGTIPGFDFLDGNQHEN